MDLTQFYKDLLTFRTMHLEDENVTFIDILEKVDDLIGEIRQDHVQGDVDDQERNG